MKRILFFGCIGSGREPGHYWAPANYGSERSIKQYMPDIPGGVIDRIDGLFTPNNPAQGNASFVRIGNLSVLSWHDYSGDSRPGSNSNIVAYKYMGDDLSVLREMWKDFKDKFPHIYKRQPQPLNVFQFDIMLPIT